MKGSIKNILLKNFQTHKYLYLSIFVSIIYFLYSYWLYIGRPGIYPDGSWYTNWYDQSQYYKIADGIIHNRLKPGNLTYPIGYPALAAPFFILFPRDPFLFPDLLLLTGTIMFFFLTISKFIKSQLAFFVVLVLLASTRLILDSIVPWTTSVTTFTFSALLFLALFHNKKPTVPVFAGVLTGFTFLSRPIDAVFLLPLILYLIFTQPKLQSKVRVLFITTIINFIFLGIFFLTNSKYAISPFGSYFKATENAGIYPQGIPERIFGYFINSNTIQRETHFAGGSLLTYSIFYLFLPIGILYLINLNRSLSKRFLFLTSSCFLIWLITYFSLNIPVPQGLKYGSLHLATVWYSFFTLLSIVGIYSILDNNFLTKHSKIILVYFIFITILPIISKTISAKNLNRNSWTITSSDNSKDAINIIDGDSYSTWDGGTQKSNKYFQVDFGKVITISRIYIETKAIPDGFPRFSPTLEGSLNGTIWYDISMDKTMPRDPPSSFINYPTMLTPAKYLRTTLSKDAEPVHWTVSNLLIFGYNHKLFYLPTPPYSGQTLLHWFKTQ